MASATDDTSVRVCLRVRPLMGHEKAQNCSSVISYPSPEIVQIGTDRTFAFDYVKSEKASQVELYEDCVSAQVSAFMQGYNATIIAYGQTGSGKTFTMGTASNANVPLTQLGIVPRVVREVFSMIEQRKATTKYTVRVSFLEIHNEEMKDLLAPAHSTASPSGESSTPISSPTTTPTIREGPDGQIIIMGATEEEVSSAEEMLSCLERGTQARTVAATLMNQHSSRSHAIFTLQLMQQRGAVSTDSTSSSSTQVNDQDDEILRSKFHFVDLAGSERLKRTGAVGERMREGISINCGLLALGNVISALGDPTRRGQHVPFRDSKITRLLQDSLGGNSKTLMIACVSPADINFEESLNTLKYANRARNIKNKAVINRDPNAAKLAALRERIMELESILSLAGIRPDDVATLSAIALSPNSNTSSPTTPEESIIALLRNVGSTIAAAGYTIGSTGSGSVSQTASSAASSTNPNAVKAISGISLQQISLSTDLSGELLAARQTAHNYESEIKRLNGRLKEVQQQLSQAQDRAIHSETARDAIRLKMERIVQTVRDHDQLFKQSLSDEKLSLEGSEGNETNANNANASTKSFLSNLHQLVEEFKSDAQLSPGELSVLDENRRTIQMLQTKLDRKKRALSEALGLVKTLTRNLHGSATGAFDFTFSAGKLSSETKHSSGSSRSKSGKSGVQTSGNRSNRSNSSSAASKSSRRNLARNASKQVQSSAGDNTAQSASDDAAFPSAAQAALEQHAADRKLLMNLGVDLGDGEADIDMYADVEAEQDGDEGADDDDDADHAENEVNEEDDATNTEDRTALLAAQAEEQTRAQLEQEAEDSDEEELLADMHSATTEIKMNARRPSAGATNEDKSLGSKRTLEPSENNSAKVGVASSDQDFNDDSDIDDDVQAFNVISKLKEMEFQRQMNRMSSVHRDLDVEIAEKQDLIVQLTRTRERADEEKRDYEQKIRFMEQEILATQQESTRAVQEQKDSEQASIQSKLYQEKIRQLETRLRDLQSKTKEMERLRSLYASDELKIKRLEEEIIATKRERARLDRMMREKREEHRAWMAEQTKKIQLLAKESQRNKLQVQDLKSQLTKERAVARRRAEENAALHRLLDLRAERRRRVDSIRSGAAFARPSTSASGTPAASPAAFNGSDTPGAQSDEQTATAKPPKLSRAQMLKAQQEARESGWVGIGQPERRTATTVAATAQATAMLGFGPAGAQAAAQAIQQQIATRRNSQPTLTGVSGAGALAAVNTAPAMAAPQPYVGERALASAKNEVIRSVEHAVSRYELQLEMRKMMRQLISLEQKEDAANERYSLTEDPQETTALETLLDTLRSAMHTLQASIEVAVSEYDHLLPSVAPLKGDRRGLVSALRAAVKRHLERRQKHAERERSRNQLRAVLHNTSVQEDADAEDPEIDTYDDLIDSRGSPIITGVDVDMMTLQNKAGVPGEAVPPAARSLLQHVMEQLARTRAINQRLAAQQQQLQSQLTNVTTQASTPSGSNDTISESSLTSTSRAQKSREALLERQVRELTTGQLSVIKSLRAEFMERIKPLKLTQQQLDVVFMPLDNRRDKILQSASALGITLEPQEHSNQTQPSQDQGGIKGAPKQQDDVLTELPRVGSTEGGPFLSAFAAAASNESLGTHTIPTVPSTPPGGDRGHTRKRSESHGGSGNGGRGLSPPNHFTFGFATSSGSSNQAVSPSSQYANAPPPPPSPRPRSVGQERATTNASSSRTRATPSAAGQGDGHIVANGLTSGNASSSGNSGAGTDKSKRPNVFERLTDESSFTGASRQTAHERRAALAAAAATVTAPSPSAGTANGISTPHATGIQSDATSGLNTHAGHEDTPEGDASSDSDTQICVQTINQHAVRNAGISNQVASNPAPAPTSSAIVSVSTSSSVGRPLTAGAASTRRKPNHPAATSKGLHVNVGNAGTAQGGDEDNERLTPGEGVPPANSSGHAAVTRASVFERLADPSRYTGVARVRLESNDTANDGPGGSVTSANTVPRPASAQHRLGERMTTDMLSELRNLQQLHQQVMKPRDRNAKSSGNEATNDADEGDDHKDKDTAGSAAQIANDRRGAASAFESAFSVPITSAGDTSSRLQHLRARAARRNGGGSISLDTSPVQPAQAPQLASVQAQAQAQAQAQSQIMPNVRRTANASPVPPPPEGTPPSGPVTPTSVSTMAFTTSTPPVPGNSIRPTPLAMLNSAPDTSIWNNSSSSMSFDDSKRTSAATMPGIMDGKKVIGTILPPPPPTPCEASEASFKGVSGRLSGVGTSATNLGGVLAHLSAEALTAALEAASDDDEEGLETMRGK